MSELDLLKKDWNKDYNFPKVTEKEIYGMLHKKSSSIVKWIFIISIIEILVWTAISFFTADDNYFKTLEHYHIDTLMKIIMTINYVIVFVFIGLFYNNFRRINTTDSVKSLMQNILKTRKTVKYYIWYNLGMMAITFVIIMIATFKYDNRITEVTSKLTNNGDSYLFWIVMTLITIVILAVMLICFWLFYRLIYGFLLRRLHKNYEELKKIDL